MSLHAVQSFIRSVILRDPSEAEFHELLNDPGFELSTSERANLAAIPHARIAEYANQFYLAEASVMRWLFHHTWRLLSPLQFGMPPDTPDPARRFLSAFKSLFPSRTHSSRETCTLFLRFLDETQGPLIERSPWLAELARMESIENFVYYAQDNPIGKAVEESAVQVLFGRTLAELSAVKVVRAEAVTGFTGYFDLAAIRAYSAKAGERVDGIPTEFPFTPVKRALGQVCARHPKTLEATWYQSVPLELSVLSALPETEPWPLENVIDRFVEGLEADPESLGDPALAGQLLANEEQLLQSVLNTLGVWFKNRCLLIVP